jgi:hypothetical protein
MNEFLLTGLLAPIWFPLLRLAISFFQSSRPTKATIWWYAITLLWTAGWIAFQWGIKIPSGIGYGLGLITGWLIMFAAFATEVIGLNYSTARKQKETAGTESNNADTSESEARRESATTRFSWALILIVGAVASVLWLRREYLQSEIEVEKQKATEFVRGHSLVIQKAGQDPSPFLSSYSANTGDFPVSYEFSTRAGYAIVSVVQSPGKREFHLDCITNLSLGGRDPRLDPCKQGIVSTESDQKREAPANSSVNTDAAR